MERDDSASGGKMFASPAGNRIPRPSIQTLLSQSGVLPSAATQGEMDGEAAARGEEAGRSSIPPAPAGIDPPLRAEPTRAARPERASSGPPREFLKNWIKLYKFTTFFDKFTKIYLVVF